MLNAKRPEFVTLAVALYIVAVLNLPFWKLFLGTVAPNSVSEWAFVAATAVGLLALLNAILLSFALRPVFRIVLAVLLPVTAAASYFMHEYGVVIDVNMVRNVFETDSREAGDLISTRMALAVGVLGVLPAVLLWRVPWVERGYEEDFRAKLKAAAVSLAVAAIAIFPFWGDVLSTFREKRELRLTLTPSNYMTALSRYFGKHLRSGTVVVKAYGEDAHRAQGDVRGPRKSLFVIVIGETARADHFQLNGYARATNPELLKIDGLINFPKAYSCGTDTAQSVPCMFSGLGRKNFSNDAAASRENLLDILKRAGFDVIWRENQAGCKGVCARVTTENLTGLQHPTFYARSENLDEILVDGLADRIAHLERDTVIVMHMMGSHGPAYWKRYPDKFEVFQPVCRESQFSRCTLEEIVNAYDNTMLYSDFVLGRLIGILGSAAAHSVDTGMIYMSDHGESLGENGLYLHGMPYAIAPEAQTHVPMVAWLSPTLVEKSGADRGCLAGRSGDATGHDHLFHSVLGLLDVSTKAYDPALDLFAPCRRKSGT